MTKEDFKVGQQFFCPSDTRTREIIEIISGRITLKCLDCRATATALTPINPLTISEKQLLKDIEWKIFVLREDRLVIEEATAPPTDTTKTPVNEEKIAPVQKKQISLPPLQAKPKTPKQDQTSLF